MTSVQVHFPDSLARKAAELAEKDHITLDQFASIAVAEKASARLTAEEMELLNDLCRNL